MSTFVLNTLSAVVFVDNTGDGTFQPGDSPQAGIQVDLVISPPLGRRAAPLCIVLDTATTNSAGAVNFGFGVVPPNSTLCISRHQSCVPCFVTIQASHDGRIPENTTLEVYIPPSTTTAPVQATTAPAQATTAPASSTQTATQPATSSATQSATVRPSPSTRACTLLTTPGLPPPA
jgi:hypothetical protein